MKMIKAVMALEVIWLPQVAPTSWTCMSVDEMWNACPRADATFWLTSLVSVPVCTVHWWVWLVNWMVESPPPAWVTTREIAPWLVAELSGNEKLDPPVNSSEKFSPRTSKATTLTSRMMPEITYHSRWRWTNLMETSPRYSRPAMPPPRAIMPPSRSRSYRRSYRGSARRTSAACGPCAS